MLTRPPLFRPASSFPGCGVDLASCASLRERALAALHCLCDDLTAQGVSLHVSLGSKGGSGEGALVDKWGGDGPPLEVWSKRREVRAVPLELPCVLFLFRLSSELTPLLALCVFNVVRTVEPVLSTHPFPNHLLVDQTLALFRVRLLPGWRRRDPDPSSFG